MNLCGCQVGVSQNEREAKLDRNISRELSSNSEHLFGAELGGRETGEKNPSTHKSQFRTPNVCKHPPCWSVLEKDTESLPAPEALRCS